MHVSSPQWVGGDLLSRYNEKEQKTSRQQPLAEPVEAEA